MRDLTFTEASALASWDYWHSQARQLPGKRLPGVSYFGGRLPTGIVNCLLHYDRRGELDAVLYHYPVDFPPFERAGNVNLIVRPDRRRQGIGRELMAELGNRPWHIRPRAEQRLSPAGKGFLEALDQSDDRRPTGGAER